MSQTEQQFAFEDIRAAFLEIARRQEELARRQEETDRQMKETDRQMKETDRRMKETDRRVGEMTNRFGELAEHLVAPSIREKFNALGYHFTRSSQNVDISLPENERAFAEIDILLENGDLAIAIEVKSKPLYKDIDRHLERMEVLRQAADERGDRRKFRGAVAGAILSTEVRDYILKAGFYVIEQTGDTVRVDAPAGFTPREW
jgi:hypothetical protein